MLLYPQAQRKSFMGNIADNLAAKMGWQRASKSSQILADYHSVGLESLPLGPGRKQAGADGIYYVDRRLPFLVADQSAVTPTTTYKNIWANGATSPTILPANYWTVGKTLRLTANIKLTTGTAGNSAFSMAYGAADAPAAVVATVTRAKIASVGPFGVFMTGFATCRSTGTSGTLSMWGMVYPDLGVFLSTTVPFVFPSGGTTVVSTIDTTVGTNSLFFQYLTSAGTDSILATDIILESMN